MNMNRILLIVFTTASFLLAANFNMSLRDRTLSPEFYLKNVLVGESRATLLALPISFSGDLGENVFTKADHLYCNATTTPAYASSSLENSSILRVASTKVRTSYIWRDLVIGNFGIKIPTGLNQFTAEQLSTIGNVATRQLQIKNGNLFNGMEIELGAAASKGIKDIGSGDLTVGGGLSTLLKFPYTPAEIPKTSFSPGHEFNILGAGEYDFIAFDRRNAAMLELGWTFYGNDKTENGPTNLAGSKFNWALNLGTDVVEEMPATLRIANYQKTANKYEKTGETQKDASDLIITLRSTIPEILTEYSPFGKIQFASYSGGGAGGFGSATIFTLGAGGSMRLTERMFVSGEAGLDMGKLEKDGLFGFEIGGGLDYKF